MRSFFYRSAELEDEKVKMEKLLQELLPQSVFHSLKMGQQVAPEVYEDVTVFFSDIVGFTRISAAGTPLQVVQMLNIMYTIFDRVSSRFDVYKVATIGDAYFVASGVPVRNVNHAAEIGGMAIALLKAAYDCPIPHIKDENLKLRVGIHSGSCVAGVVGTKMPRYLLFGDTVDVASRMESEGLAMQIHISDVTAKHLRATDGFKVTARGITDVKGYGKITTYWLTESD
jgi:class 3 adenylate cyclase